MAQINESYNNIRFVDDQCEILKDSLFECVRDSIRDIYLEHHAHYDFGIALLHRHHRLPPEHAMIHFRNNEGQDICYAERLGQRKICPCAYQLCGGRFIPYEYSSAQTPVPDEDFLSELAICLRKNHLESLIAVSYVPFSDEIWLETLAREFEGTIATRVSITLDPFSGHHAITEWAIRGDPGVACMVPMKACRKLENGGHDRTSKLSHLTSVAFDEEAAIEAMQGL